jgi:CDP-ribitol ribitolphosphotransferase
MIRKVSDVEYFMNAVDYIREAATAKAVFITTANRLMSQFDLRPETRLIQLWHGVGMFKKVGFSTLDSEGFGRSAKSREVYNDYRNYTDVTVAAEEQIWTFEDAFHISRDTGIFKPIGISRTDVFFDEEYRKERRRRLDEAFPECKGKKIILYAPTFRGRVAQATAPDELDIKKMAEKLSDDYVLLIRHHEVSKVFPKIPEEVEGSFAFDMNRNNIMSTDGLLSIADILITDYSSLGFEFAVMEKPMVFFAYDLEEYLDTRGMYYDYSEITPGPVCKTTEEVADYIADIDNRFDRNAVREFREKYVGACDGHATERTIALIEQ